MENNHLSFLTSDLKTIEYIDYMASYKVQEIETIDKLVENQKLISPWPLYDLYDYDKKFKYICPKYPF